MNLQAEIISIDALQIGDHVAVMTTANFVEIQHHGIVVSGEKVLKVISFTSNQKRAHASYTGTIHEENLRNFSGGNRYIIRIKYPANEVFAPEWVQYRARRLLAHPKEFQTYDYLRNNCEHFATFCKAGEKQSDQASLKGIVSALARSITRPAISSYKTAQQWKGY